jgi:hypothetical protein
MTPRVTAIVLLCALVLANASSAFRSCVRTGSTCSSTRSSAGFKPNAFQRWQWAYYDVASH